MAKREEIQDTELRSFEKNADKSFGHQAGAETQEENEELSRKKFLDAEREYFERGEDKEEFKMYDPATHHPNQEQQDEKQNPAERLNEIDNALMTETDRDTRQELVNERIELSEQLRAETQEREAQQHEQSQDRDFDR